IVDGRVLCVHGGLSPDVRTLDQIRTIQRSQEIPHEGAFCGNLYFNSKQNRLDVVRSGGYRDMGHESKRSWMVIWKKSHVGGLIHD
ncbi:Serine/threonine-protein phosphatase 6 catalytic subunit, partial [Globomyces sp. JEL0801]